MIISGLIPCKKKKAIIIHGGAWDIPHNETEQHVAGLKEAISLGKSLMELEEAPIEVARKVIKHLENHHAFDAGVGSVLNRAGEVEMDAGIMDGLSGKYGAVAAVKRIQNPIEVATHLLKYSDGQARFLVGDGAEHYAKEYGFSLVRNEYFRLKRELDRYQLIKQLDNKYHTSRSFSGQKRTSPKGTVGCVVHDGNGSIVAGTSTGGAPYTFCGRVGDSPIPGAGYYATKFGGASATGWGEAIAATLLCFRSVIQFEQTCMVDTILEKSLETMLSSVENSAGEGATGGLITIHHSGTLAWAYSTPKMARAYWVEGRSTIIAL